MAAVAIYVRQSADRADSVSLETQEALCRQDAPPDAEIRVYSDRGRSGKNTDRPALHALLRDIRGGLIGTVLVYKLDRISRNLADFTQLLREFQQRGIQFASHTERFETASPMGQAMQALLMVFAQLERETICGRVRDAAFARAKAGFDPGGAAPVGFTKIPAQLRGKRTQMLSPDAAAPVIRAGFLRYLTAGCTLSGLAREWNAGGFLTARGGQWSSGTLCRVLRNPVYVQADAAVCAHLAARGAVLCVPEPLPEGHGICIYTDRRVSSARLTDLHGALAVSAQHRGLVPAEIWLAVQEKLEASRKIRTLGQGAGTWLSGLIFCGNCGSAMTSAHGRSRVYLVCGGKKRGRCGGAGAVWHAETAEALIGTLLSGMLTRLRAQGVPVRDRGDAAALTQTRAELLMRQAEIVREMAAPAGGALAALREAAAQIAAQLRDVEAQLAAVQRSRTPALPQWSDCDAQMRRRIARVLLRGVWVQGTALFAVSQ